MATSRFAEARVRVHELEQTFVRPGDWADMLDVMACQVLSKETTAAYPLAREWVETALKYEPNRLSLRGTLASLDVELGNWERAEPELRTVYRRSSSDFDQAVTGFYLARAARRRGDAAAARKLALRVAALTRQRWLRSRLEREFGAELGIASGGGPTQASPK